MLDSKERIPAIDSRPAYGRYMTSRVPLDKLSKDRLLLAGTAVLLVVSTGVGLWSVMSPEGDGTPTVKANVSERYDSFETLSATRETVIERNGTVASRTVSNVTLAPETRQRRVELRSSSRERYDLRVSNGSVLWLHDRTGDRVLEIPLTGPSQPTVTADRIRRLLVRANLTEREETGKRPAVEPLPVVPQERAGPTRRASTYSVNYTGKETVGGRETYVISIAPHAVAADTYQQTLWIDTAVLYPVQRRTVWRDDGVRTELTTTYTDISFASTVDPATFRPEIGPNTTVETADTPETAVFRRRSALSATTSLRVPDPELLPSYELAYATRTTGGTEGIGLRYVNRTGAVTVSKYNFTYRLDEADDRTRVDGRSATISYGQPTYVSWNCDGYRYTVQGSGLQTDQLVDIARSVGCPG